jgi:hypothetical protein
MDKELQAFLFGGSEDEIRYENTRTVIIMYLVYTLGNLRHNQQKIRAGAQEPLRALMRECGISSLQLFQIPIIFEDWQRESCTASITSSLYYL